MQSYNVGKQYVIVRARAEDTGGVLSLLEMHHSPETGPPLHVHKYEDEGFYILEGNYRFTLFAPEKQTREVGPGEFVMAARRVPHSFRSLGPEIGRMLVYFTPGGAEGYFEASSRIPPEDPERTAKRQALEDKYGTTILPRKPPTP